MMVKLPLIYTQLPILTLIVFVKDNITYKYENYDVVCVNIPQ